MTKHIGIEQSEQDSGTVDWAADRAARELLDELRDLGVFRARLTKLQMSELGLKRLEFEAAVNPQSTFGEDNVTQIFLDAIDAELYRRSKKE